MCLTPDQFDTIQTILNSIGEEDFINHWRTYKEEQEKLENDFRRRPILGIAASPAVLWDITEVPEPVCGISNPREWRV
jgi:hypothetical protein